MGRLLFAAALLVAACGGTAERPAPESPEDDQIGTESPASHVVDCLPRLEGSKIEARLPAGYTLRQLIVWYGAVTCKSVVAPRELLGREAPVQLDAVVTADKVDELFRSALADLDLASLREGDLLIIVDRATEPVVFTTSRVDDEPEKEESAEPIEGIKRLSDTHYVLERAALEKLIEDPAQHARGARLVPSIKNGKPNGFKIYAIRPKSIFARLGFENGDTVHSINGRDVHSADQALEVYSQLRDADRVEVSLTRRGQPVTLVFEVE